MQTAVSRLLCVVCSVAVSLAAQQPRDVCANLRNSYGEGSDTVLTGTVLRLESRDGRAEVRVKRVLKGPAYLKPVGTIRVEGATTAHCHGDAKLRTRDTRIFMLENISNSDIFRLNGSLLRITVPNLERVSAVVKGEPYKRRSPILDKPCEQKYCPWGGDCVESGRGDVQCHCPETCPVGYTPVCGSNGVTYPNECRLRREACNKKTRVFLRHNGPCSPTTSG